MQRLVWAVEGGSMVSLHRVHVVLLTDIENAINNPEVTETFTLNA